jgi:hypothetical protein
MRRNEVSAAKNIDAKKAEKSFQSRTRTQWDLRNMTADDSTYALQVSHGVIDGAKEESVRECGGMR